MGLLAKFQCRACRRSTKKQSYCEHILRHHNKLCDGLCIFISHNKELKTQYGGYLQAWPCFSDHIWCKRTGQNIA